MSSGTSARAASGCSASVMVAASVARSFCRILKATKISRGPLDGIEEKTAGAEREHESKIIGDGARADGRDQRKGREQSPDNVADGRNPIDQTGHASRL